MTNVDDIFAQVWRSLSAANIEDDGKVLVLGTHNAAFGNSEKAQLFLPVYREFVRKHHLLAWQEVDQTFMQTIADAAGGECFSAYCSEANSRGQAVGFTLHKRLHVDNITTYKQVQNINNIADLRPALRLDLTDRVTGLKVTVVVVHYKSNYGGLRATSPVRHKQAQALVDALQVSDQFALLLGDFNQLLEVATDADPLLEGGFSFFPRYDRAATHVNGGRLDGLMIKNVPATVKITDYRVRNFWRHDKIGPVLSDHGLLSWKIVVGGSPGLSG